MFATQPQATIPTKGKQFKHKPSGATCLQAARRKSSRNSASECTHLKSANASRKPPPESSKQNLNGNMKSGVLLLLLLLLAVALSSYIAPVDADGRWSRSSYSSDDTTAVTSKARVPYFSEVPEESKRHRAIVGRPVRFECVVMDLGHRSVAWFHKSRTHALLAIGNKTHLFKDRMKASIQGNSIFSLEIKKVELQDEGEYLCQITNLPPDSPQNQHHFLEVLQSPQIRENESTIKIKPVDEGKPVEMRCVAYGVPKPVIKWRRQSRLIELPQRPSDANEVTANELAGEGETNQELPATQPAASDEQSQVAARSRGKRSSPESGAGKPFACTKDEKMSHPLDAGLRQRRARNVAPIFAYYGGRTRRSSTALTQSFHQSLASSSSPTTATLPGSTTSLNPRISGAGNKPIRAEGEVFRIERVSRYDMGYYECIASNGVQPAVSQLIFLPVNWQNGSAGLNPRDSNRTAFTTSSTATSNSSKASRKSHPIAQATDGLDDSLVSVGADNKMRTGASVGSGRNFQQARYRQHKAARSAAPPKLATLNMSLLTGLALLWCTWLLAAAT